MTLVEIVVSLLLVLMVGGGLGREGLHIYQHLQERSQQNQVVELLHFAATLATIEEQEVSLHLEQHHQKVHYSIEHRQAPVCLPEGLRRGYLNHIVSYSVDGTQHTQHTLSVSPWEGLCCRDLTFLNTQGKTLKLHYVKHDAPPPYPQTFLSYF